MLQNIKYSNMGCIHLLRKQILRRYLWIDGQNKEYELIYNITHIRRILFFLFSCDTMNLLFWSWSKNPLQRQLINPRKWNKHESVNGPNCSWKTSAYSSPILAVDQFAMLQSTVDSRPLEMQHRRTATFPQHLKEVGPCPAVLFSSRRSLREKQLRCINHGNGNDGERELILIYVYPSIKAVKGISWEMNIANNYSH